MLALADPGYRKKMILFVNMCDPLAWRTLTLGIPSIQFNQKRLKSKRCDKVDLLLPRDVTIRQFEAHLVVLSVGFSSIL